MIKLKGVVGWDINGIDFADMISRFSGDIDIEVDSPGGIVSDGISIFNALKRYDKGKINITVVGECSSIMAYIVLAADTLKFEPNSIVVLHHPWAGACGDFRTMKHQAEILENLSKLYALEFVKKGIFNEAEIYAAMDEERWFIGKEDLSLLGEVIDRGDIPKLEEIEKQALANEAKGHINAWQSKLEKQYSTDLNNIAAMVKDMLPKAAMKPTENISITKDINLNSERTKKMDLNELKNSHEKLYAEVLNIGEQKGIEKTQKRVKALLQFIDIDKETVIKAINEGKSIQDDDVYAALTMAKIKSNEMQAMTKENPPKVNPAEPEHAPESAAALAQKTKENQAKKDAELEEAILKYTNV